MKTGPATIDKPMVQILRLQARRNAFPGEYWRYSQLCEPFDLFANESMGPMTAMFGRGKNDIGLRGNSTCNRFHCHTPVQPSMSKRRCRRTMTVLLELNPPILMRDAPVSDAIWKTLAIATTILAAASSRVQTQADLTASANANAHINAQVLPSQ